MELAGYIISCKAAGKKTGFVPTMGALHPGHQSLLESSMLSTDLTVCSIFINPTQFNDPADFRRYPLTIEQDVYLLEQSGVDILFLPEVNEIYPNGTGQLPQYDLGNLEDILEGKYRPGHFQGVCQVMHRLLDVVQPNHLYMGQKDYQQCLVVKRLIQMIESNVVLHTCPTVRESDGLAMSSRNMRLTEQDRKKALAIHDVLKNIKENIRPGSLGKLITDGRMKLEQNDLVPDYLEIAHASSLQPVTNWDGNAPLIALAAAYIHEVRLIDNMRLND